MNKLEILTKHYVERNRLETSPGYQGREPRVDLPASRSSLEQDLLYFLKFLPTPTLAICTGNIIMNHTTINTFLQASTYIINALSVWLDHVLMYKVSKWGALWELLKSFLHFDQLRTKPYQACNLVIEQQSLHQPP